MDYAFETIIATFLAFAGFFGSRTLSNYDRRIQATEDKHDDILAKLSKIEKEAVAISTRLEYLDK